MSRWGSAFVVAVFWLLLVSVGDGPQLLLLLLFHHWLTSVRVIYRCLLFLRVSGFASAAVLGRIRLNLVVLIVVITWQHLEVVVVVVVKPLSFKNRWLCCRLRDWLLISSHVELVSRLRVDLADWTGVSSLRVNHLKLGCPQLLLSLL